MLDDEFQIPRSAKASLVSIINSKFEYHRTENESNQSLLELHRLLETLGIEVTGDYVQKKKNVEAGTILGTGKLLEIAVAAKELGSDLLVFDFELTSSQIRNIKKITDLAVVDRCHVILEIFAQHARTKEAKIQIEISRLQYLLPRLAGFWSHLSRQKGGIAVKGGEGEQQIELDRRIVRQRIEHYKEELKSITKSRQQQKKKRQNKAVIAALVGYTNAGKSSLLNRLCREKILEEDKLFATLDSTHRMLNPDTKPHMILVDTVGFIANLPSTLIEGFKTTLESAVEADLLIIVCDVSDTNYEKHLAVTNSILRELGITEKERIIVFNKSDLLKDEFKKKIILRKNPNSFIVSSFNPDDINQLRSKIINHFLDKQEKYDIFIPYADASAHSKVIGHTNIITTTNYNKGIFYQIRVPLNIFGPLKIQSYILAPDDPLYEEFKKDHF